MNWSYEYWIMKEASIFNALLQGLRVFLYCREIAFKSKDPWCRGKSSL